jgi:hypothetical protein
MKMPTVLPANRTLTAVSVLWPNKLVLPKNKTKNGAGTVKNRLGVLPKTKPEPLF